jgi:Zn-dependent peptidase ImmA (M78 family)
MSEDLGWSQGKVSKCENGLLGLSPLDLERIAEYLNYPIDFFRHDEEATGFATCCLYHRKRQSMPARVLHQLHAQVNIQRIRLAQLLAGESLEHGFHRMDIDEYDGCPETVARILRASWGIPPVGPIKNLVKVVEEAGGIVVECDFDTTKLDAVSQWPASLPPMFFINRRIPVDRWRWTLAHEIGHIVMHTIPSPDAEREADQFASEFLMPARSIAGELAGLSIAKAARLKLTWRVSMQALIRRAKDLGQITERKYRSLFAAMSKLGYRKVEPAPLAPERPAAIKNLISCRLDQDAYSVAELSRLMLTTEDEFREQYMEGTEAKLRVIK